MRDAGLQCDDLLHEGPRDAEVRQAGENRAERVPTEQRRGPVGLADDVDFLASRSQHFGDRQRSQVIVLGDDDHRVAVDVFTHHDPSYIVHTGHLGETVDRWGSRRRTSCDDERIETGSEDLFGCGQVSESVRRRPARPAVVIDGRRTRAVLPGPGPLRQ